MLPTVALLALLLFQSRAPFYWGTRAPVVAPGKPARASLEARVTEVHAAVDAGDLVLRLSFDREVRSALRQSDGTPTSGRLHAVVYFDVDSERETGFAGAANDPRTGCERRLEIGALFVGEDPDEDREAVALVTTSLAEIDSGGRRSRVWNADEESDPSPLLVWRDWIELRIPSRLLGVQPSSRLVLSQYGGSWSGLIP